MFFSKILCGSPENWQTSFSDPASTAMEGILIFNKHLLFLLTVIVLFVGWILIFTIYYYSDFSNNFKSNFTHATTLEIVWTSVPAVILLILILPI